MLHDLVLQEVKRRSSAASSIPMRPGIPVVQGHESGGDGGGVGPLLAGEGVAVLPMELIHEPSCVLRLVWRFDRKV